MSDGRGNYDCEVVKCKVSVCGAVAGLPAVYTLARASNELENGEDDVLSRGAG